MVVNGVPTVDIVLAQRLLSMRRLRFPVLGGGVSDVSITSSYSNLQLTEYPDTMKKS